MLKISIKANSVTNLTDARYFAARGADWMGFRLEPGHEDSVSTETFEEIRGWIDGVKIVGEFDLMPVPQIRQIAKERSLDAVQVGMFAERDALMGMKNLILIKEVVLLENMEEIELLEHFLDYSPFCQYFLLDFIKSGITWADLQKNRPLPLKVFQSLCKHNRVFIHIDMTPATLPSIVSTLKPFGICVRGGSEEKPGYKSYDELDAIFDLFELA